MPLRIGQNNNRQRGCDSFPAVRANIVKFENIAYQSAIDKQKELIKKKEFKKLANYAVQEYISVLDRFYNRRGLKVRAKVRQFEDKTDSTDIPVAPADEIKEIEIVQKRKNQFSAPERIVVVKKEKITHIPVQRSLVQNHIHKFEALASQTYKDDESVVDDEEEETRSCKHYPTDVFNKSPKSTKKLEEQIVLRSNESLKRIKDFAIDHRNKVRENIRKFELLRLGIYHRPQEVADISEKCEAEINDQTLQDDVGVHMKRAKLLSNSTYSFGLRFEDKGYAESVDQDEKSYSSQHVSKTFDTESIKSNESDKTFTKASGNPSFEESYHVRNLSTASDTQSATNTYDTSEAGSYDAESFVDAYDRQSPVITYSDHCETQPDKQYDVRMSYQTESMDRSIDSTQMETYNDTNASPFEDKEGDAVNYTRAYEAHISKKRDIHDYESHDVRPEQSFVDVSRRQSVVSQSSVQSRDVGYAREKQVSVSEQYKQSGEHEGSIQDTTNTNGYATNVVAKAYIGQGYAKVYDIYPDEQQYKTKTIRKDTSSASEKIKTHSRKSSYVPSIQKNESSDTIRRIPKININVNRYDSLCIRNLKKTKDTQKLSADSEPGETSIVKENILKFERLRYSGLPFDLNEIFDL